MDATSHPDPEGMSSVDRTGFTTSVVDCGSSSISTALDTRPTTSSAEDSSHVEQKITENLNQMKAAGLTIVMQNPDPVEEIRVTSESCHFDPDAFRPRGKKTNPSAHKESAHHPNASRFMGMKTSPSAHKESAQQAGCCCIIC